MKTKHWNESDFREAINRLEDECNVLERLQIGRGQKPERPAATKDRSDIILQHESLESYRDDLIAKLSAPVAVAPIPAPVSTRTAPDPTVTLTADELAQIPWTDKVKIAQGFLDPAKVRADLQNKALNWTQRALKSRGVKTLAEARAKQNPHCHD